MLTWRSMAVLAVACGLVSCGGDDGATSTVVTVTQPSAAPPAASTPGEPPAPAEPAAPPAEPVANLPDGAVAVQGSYRMEIVQVTDNSYAASGDEDEEGAERLWEAETVCEGACRVQLRRQLKNGAYEKATLAQGDDPRSFGETTKVEAKYCVSTEASTGPATKRVSLRATAVEDRNGQQTAKRIEGYFSVTQTCQRGDLKLAGRATVKLRGTLEG